MYHSQTSCKIVTVHGKPQTATSCTQVATSLLRKAVKRDLAALRSKVLHKLWD